MTIPTPVTLGSTSAAAGSATLALTTLVDAPAGSLIFVSAAWNTSAAISSCADSAGNTYTADTVANPPGGYEQRSFYSNASVDLPAGSTITVTYSATTNVKVLQAFAVNGVTTNSASDKGVVAVGTSVSPSASTGVLVQAAEIIFASVGIAGGTATVTGEGSGFTSLGSVASGTIGLHSAYKIVAATTTVTYAPTLSASVGWSVDLRSFRASTANRFLSVDQGRIIELIASATTTPNSVVGVGPSGQLDSSWIAANVVFAAVPYNLQVPVTGFSITIGANVGKLILQPAGTLASGTITMPAAPIDGQEVAVASTAAVTALTMAANTGQTLLGGLTTIAANGFGKWTYSAGTWFRTG